MSMRATGWGQPFFAVTMIGLGILGLVQGEFTSTWSGVPAGFPGREGIVYLCAFISVGSGLGLLSQRTAPVASRVLLGAFLGWLLLFRVPLIFRAPTSSGVWWATADTAMMAAAAWVLFTRFAGEGDRRRLGFATGDRGLRIARMLYGFGLIPLGAAHFTYLARTVALVPAWLPWHLGWACFTGAAFIAAGLGVLTGVYARLAATLSTWEMGLFTAVVWVPIVVAGRPTSTDWTEFVGSWVLTAAGWVVADSYRGVN